MEQAFVTTDRGEIQVLPLQKELLSDGFAVTFSREMVKGNVETVDFMPDYSPVEEGASGYFAVNNTLIRFRNHADGVYDTGYCIMPFFGVKTDATCFIAIVTGLWEQHSMIIRRQGGVYTIHPRFVLDGRAAPADMRVEYHFLRDGDADYSGMARAYRAYQLRRGACVPLRQRMNDALRYVLDAPEVRVRMAWKPVPSPVAEQTPETEPSLHVAVDFSRMAAILDACQAAGVDRAQFCLVGWNSRGHDGRWPQALPVEEKLGGEGKLRRLIQKAQSMGYQMVCHTNATDCYSIADVWSEELPMRDRAGQMMSHAEWSGGRMYDMCPVSGGETYSTETLRAVAALGFRGIHYIDVISTVPPRRCFSSAHPCTQAEFIASMRRIAALSRERIGGFQSEGGYDYLADVLDMALYVDFHLLDAVHPFCDENVPLWQMVYHDVILGNPGTVTVNYPVKDWRTRLKFFEYGGHPALYIHSRFVTGNNWMGEDDLSADSPEAIARCAASIKTAREDALRVAGLRLQAMVRHERQGDLCTVTYADGTRMVCNYGEADRVVDGIQVPAHDFAVIPAVCGTKTGKAGGFSGIPADFRR